MSVPRSLSRWLWWFCFGLGFLLPGFSVLPFGVVRQYLDQFAGDGSAEPYTPAIHLRLQVAATATGIGLLAITVWLWFRPPAGAVDRPDSVSRTLWRRLKSGGLPLIAVTLLAAIVRAIYIAQPIRHDEAYTYMTFARYPWFVGLSVYSDPNNHVLNTLLVNLSTSGFGNAEWAIRLPVFLAGVATVPLTYLAVRMVGSPLCALLAALTMATSSVMIEFSTNARGYALVSLCVAISLIALPLIARGAVRGKSAGKAWGWLIAATAVACWTVPTALYPSVILWTWLIFTVRRIPDTTRRRRFLSDYVISALLTGAITIALYSPVFLVSGPLSVIANPYVRPLSLERFLLETPKGAYEAYQLLFRDSPGPLQWILLASVLRLALPSGSRRDPRSYRGPALIAGLFAMVMIIGIQRVIPPARVMQFLVPLAIIVGFAGAAGRLAALNAGSRRAAWWLGLGLCGVWPLASLFAYNSVLRSEETGVFPEARRVLQHIRDDAAARGVTQPRIVTIFPVGAPVTYTALRYGFDMQAFERPQPQELRNAVILSTITYHQSVREVLEGSAAAPPEFADRFCEGEKFPTVLLYRWCETNP